MNVGSIPIWTSKAVKAHMDVHSADNRKAEGSNPSHSTNFNKVVDIEMWLLYSNLSFRCVASILQI